MNLNAGDRIGYRGQTQYNEKYDEDGPDIMDNPQPLAHTTYNPRELELNVNGKSYSDQFNHVLPPEVLKTNQKWTSISQIRQFERVKAAGPYYTNDTT